MNDRSRPGAIGKTRGTFSRPTPSISRVGRSSTCPSLLTYRDVPVLSHVYHSHSYPSSACDVNCQVNRLPKLCIGTASSPQAQRRNVEDTPGIPWTCQGPPSPVLGQAVHFITVKLVDKGEQGARSSQANLSGSLYPLFVVTASWRDKTQSFKV